MILSSRRRACSVCQSAGDDLVDFYADRADRPEREPAIDTPQPPEFLFDNLLGRP